MALDYGILDDDGHIVKPAQFCAVTGRMAQIKRTHRITNTRYFFVTDATIRLTHDDIETITNEILSIADTEPVKPVDETSDAKPKKTRTRKKPTQNEEK